MARGVVHEIYAVEDHPVAASAFALLLAVRADAGRPILLLREDRRVRTAGRWYGDGVADLGGDPRCMVIVHAADAPSLLRAAGDAVACGDLGTVVIETGHAQPRFDLTVTRRLALRAERSGVVVLLVRAGTEPVPSAATTRWLAASASSQPRRGCPGETTFDLRLLRHRGGIAGFAARVEWDRDRRRFRDAPLPGRVPAAACGGTGDPGWRRVA